MASSEDLPKTPKNRRESILEYILLTKTMVPTQTKSDLCLHRQSSERCGEPLTLQVWSTLKKPSKSEPDFTKYRSAKWPISFPQAISDLQSPFVVKRSLEDLSKTLSNHTSLISLSSRVSSLESVFEISPLFQSKSNSVEEEKPKRDWPSLAPKEEGAPETPRGLKFPFPIRALSRRESTPGVIMGDTDAAREFDLPVDFKVNY